MNARKGLMIGLVIVCLVLAAVTYVALSPKKATQTTESEKLKAISDEMARNAQEAGPKRPEIPEDTAPMPTGKGPQRVGG